jgi:aminoglycoside phosphotransferase (APT) family kinase protein
MNAGVSSPPSGTPAAEFAFDDAFVAALLADQHPDLAHLPLTPIDVGWDNAMYRLGDELAIRLPRRAVAAGLIAHEQTWLPQLAGRLSVPVPLPLRIGAPALGYPWNWSIVRWLHGSPADEGELSPSQAESFAGFLRSLHVPAPPDAPANPFRGVPLHQRAAVVEERMRRLAGKTDLLTAPVMDIWRDALQAPIDVAPTWLHGDLHPRNVLVENGAISGIIDWSDMTSGDRATDFAAIWMLFGDPQIRSVALATYGDISEATMRRAKGWAVLFGVLMLETGLVDNPRNAAIGERTLRRVAANDSYRL